MQPAHVETLLGNRAAKDGIAGEIIEKDFMVKSMDGMPDWHFYAY